MIKVTYLYSACFKIESRDLRILCDPWFTEGAYDGSWYHFPYVPLTPEQIGECDYIFVSHIHPDHYDVAFLRMYLGIYPRARIIIAPFSHNYLAARMRADQLPFECGAQFAAGETTAWLLPNAEGPLAIDSALLVTHGRSAVANLNDNAYSLQQVDAIRRIAPNVDIALMGYTGAHAYPHTFFDIGPELIAAAEAKKSSGLQRYEHLRDAIGARVTVPCAGQYVLGGRLHYLNPYRGNADATEAAALGHDAIVLADDQAWISTTDLEPSALRTSAYTNEAMSQRSLELSVLPLRYEELFSNLSLDDVDFAQLTASAYRHAMSRSRYDQDYWLCILLGDRWFLANINTRRQDVSIVPDVTARYPRSELYIDYRCLYGALTGAFHWNNLAIGAQYFQRRYAPRWVPEVDAFLNWFHV